MDPSIRAPRLGPQGLLRARVARLNVSQAMSGVRPHAAPHARSCVGRRDAFGRRRIADADGSACDWQAPQTPIGNAFLLDDAPLDRLCVWIGMAAASAAWRPIDRDAVEPLRRAMGPDLWAKGLAVLDHDDSGLDVASERELRRHLVASSKPGAILLAIGYRSLLRIALRSESRAYLRAARIGRTPIERFARIRLHIEPETARAFIERVALPTVLSDEPWILAEA